MDKQRKKMSKLIENMYCSEIIRRLIHFDVYNSKKKNMSQK